MIMICKRISFAYLLIYSELTASLGNKITFYGKDVYRCTPCNITFDTPPGAKLGNP